MLNQIHKNQIHRVNCCHLSCKSQKQTKLVSNDFIGLENAKTIITLGYALLQITSKIVYTLHYLKTPGITLDVNNGSSVYNSLGKLKCCCIFCVSSRLFEVQF